MPTRKKHEHCSYCGSAYADDLPWPRTCLPCGNISYLNPLPVAVALLPVDGGLLCIRRTIEPRAGELALPGGFLEVGETWQEGCVRELREETGIIVSAAEVRLFAVHSAVKVGRPSDSVLLVFGLLDERRSEGLAFTANEETSEMVVMREVVELAFPTHTRAMRDWFAARMG
jgi:ADP-ribose pyrophosphatase YjhB (NUDIX family)